MLTSVHARIGNDMILYSVWKVNFFQYDYAQFGQIALDFIGQNMVLFACHVKVSN